MLQKLHFERNIRYIIESKISNKKGKGDNYEKICL